MIEHRRGEILIELIVAVAIGGVLLGGAAAIITQSLGANTQNRFIQTSALLAGELMETTAAYSKQNWTGLYELAKTSANHHYVNTGVTPFTITSGGDETVTVETTQFTRYFYVENVCRDASGVIVAGCTSGTEDPSTQLVSVVTQWPGGEPITIKRLLARTANKAFTQTDWSGGAGQATFPSGVVNNKYDVADLGVVTNTQGKLTGPSSGFATLTSSTFDACPSLAVNTLCPVALNSIVRKGSAPADSVWFQFAFSDNENGTSGFWSFQGPDGNPGTFYENFNAETVKKIESIHGNHRYFRYKIRLTNSAEVEDVIINVSP